MPSYQPNNPEHALGLNPSVKADGIQMQMTEFEVTEYLRCMTDVAYFAKNYVKVINLDKGLCPFIPYEYQERLLNHYTANKFTICLAPRQAGKSIVSVVWLLWYCIFNAEKTVALLANKRATANEMVSRFTLALENLPFFLQPGCKVLNKGSIVFSNNTTIFAAATTSSSIRGRSCNVVFLDEFAFVQNASEFYTSTYPVIASGKDVRVIITSTPNGVGNLFHQLWEGATLKKNSFKPFKINWQDVPGRDEKWMRETIANTSQRRFDQEFSCLSGDTYVDVNIDGVYKSIKLEELYELYPISDNSR